MDKATYTKGPWRVFTTTDGSKLIGIGELNGGGITDCGFGVWRGGDAEAIANARLIAAAPDLIEALDGPDPDAPECIRPLSWLHSMIAHCKARGPAPDDDDPAAFHDMIGEVEAMYVRARAALSKATGGSHEQG